MAEDLLAAFSPLRSFAGVQWSEVPDTAGVYAIYEGTELLYVGMAGRNGSGSLRRRLKDHSTGQVVNMFSQYLFLARVQFSNGERVTHPREAKAACQNYIRERCGFRFCSAPNSATAREMEVSLRRRLKPTLNAS